MLITFAFTRLAVQVRRWFEIGADATMERGARVELLLLDPQPHRGSESAGQRLVVDRPFWRADRTYRLSRIAAAEVLPEPADRAERVDLARAGRNAAPGPAPARTRSG
ncbi:hypothetical protein [Pseudonocardia alni]|uniref:hypothetical protein n=1 Tax=Pseudonocardia alni TaxID=33907 RepID=UPI0033302710